MLRPRTLLATGKTEQQWIDEMKVLEFAEKIGADGFAPTAPKAADLAKRLVS